MQETGQGLLMSTPTHPAYLRTLNNSTWMGPHLPLSGSYRPTSNLILVSNAANGEQALIGVRRYGKGKVVITAHGNLANHMDLVPAFLRWFNVRDGGTVLVLGQVTAKS